MDIIDFHAHLWPAEWGPGGKHQRPGGGHMSPEILRRIISPDALLDEFAAAGISLGVVSTTIESLFGVTGDVDAGIIPGVNDWLANLVAAHPGRLAALATVDAFSGEAGAREAERAVTKLGL